MLLKGEDYRVAMLLKANTCTTLYSLLLSFFYKHLLDYEFSALLSMWFLARLLRRRWAQTLVERLSNDLRGEREALFQAAQGSSLFLWFYVVFLRCMFFFACLFVGLLAGFVFVLCCWIC